MPGAPLPLLWSFSGVVHLGEDYRFFLPGTIGTQGFLLWSYSTFYIVRLHCALDMDAVVLRGLANSVTRDSVGDITLLG